MRYDVGEDATIGYTRQGAERLFSVLRESIRAANAYRPVVGLQEAD